jgi:ABC-type polysaccharide/polyol phosphate transport system ATPase subunit
VAAVIVDNVTLTFPIYGPQRSLRQSLFARGTGGLIQRSGKAGDRIVVKALDGVSLELRNGDRLGLVGHNGAGKSTLLKVLAGIYQPVSGRVLANGRITSLLDTMPGLDGEDTGYENIMTAGLLFGMSRDEIERRVPDIEEFSELGEYLALPVRTYSSGMMARLALAVATCNEPDILLVDEGIGAGDARFAARAMRRVNEFFGRSRILVLASHAEPLVRSTCNKLALMQTGRIVALGGVDEVLARYHAINWSSPAVLAVAGAT